MTNKELEIKAAKARLLLVDAVYRAQSGHPGGSLSCVDALTVLYFWMSLTIFEICLYVENSTSQAVSASS